MLVDVSVLIALLMEEHPAHESVKKWATEITPVVCPVVQLGWVRISSKTYGLEISEAVGALERLAQRSEFIPCDMSVVDASHSPSPNKTTDWYLADLAKTHGIKWATLDKRANHPNAVLV